VSTCRETESGKNLGMPARGGGSVERGCRTTFNLAVPHLRDSASHSLHGRQIPIQSEATFQPTLKEEGEALRYAALTADRHDVRQSNGR
jgi:hypothetical protein